MIDLFKQKEKKDTYHLYTNMFFIDLNNVSNILLRAIKQRTFDADYNIAILHQKHTEIIQFYQSNIRKNIVLPFFYVKKQKCKQGNDLYTGGYKIKESDKYIEQPFSTLYAENLFKECKRMIENKEIPSKRIVSR